MPLFGQNSEVVWQEARWRRGGERTGKRHQASLEPVSPRAMKPVNGGLLNNHFESKAGVINYTGTIKVNWLNAVQMLQTAVTSLRADSSYGGHFHIYVLLTMFFGERVFNSINELIERTLWALWGWKPLSTLRLENFEHLVVGKLSVFCNVSLFYAVGTFNILQPQISQPNIPRCGMFNNLKCH